MIHPTSPVASPTIGQIIESALEPSRARRYANGDQARLCTTNVFTHVLDESGHEVPLERLAGRYGALYVRVSSLGQVEDDYSAEDQVRRSVEHSIRHRQAFRIFSDASLSNGLAINEPTLIRRLAISKAARHEKIFTSVFLYEHSRFTEAQRTDLRDYLEMQKAEVLRGIN